MLLIVESRVSYSHFHLENEIAEISQNLQDGFIITEYAIICITLKKKKTYFAFE